MATVVLDQDFPCSLLIHIPFPTQRLAISALRALRVDEELSPLVQRSFALVAETHAAGADAVFAAQSADNAEQNVLRVDYKATTNRMLRVAVNGFFESLGLIIQIMEELDVDVLHEGGLEDLEGVQGVVKGNDGVEKVRKTILELAFWHHPSRVAWVTSERPGDGELHEMRSPEKMQPGYTFQTLFVTLSLILLAHGSFNPTEATISSTHHDLFTGLTTCREVVSSFLSRIEVLNTHTNAVISSNPDCLAEADAADALLAANNGSAIGRLFCVPTVLKDNYDASFTPTTAGCLALANSTTPNYNAPVVDALKKAGAIILAKVNLHELALEGLSVSSVGGQTINPYDYTRTPGGSSGGTGAAVAASFAVWGTGTDTVNSLRSPASANSLFSVRPTRGLISRAGVIPISYTQDAVGPIGRCVEDVATALTVMASVGYDEQDNATALVPAGVRGTDYTAHLYAGSLQGLRLGLVEGFFNRTPSPENDPVNEAMANVTSKLANTGATIVPITDPYYNATAIADLDTQRYEYRESMDSYLNRSAMSSTNNASVPKSLQDIYAIPPGDFLVIPSQHEYVRTALVSSTSNATYNAIQAGIRNLTLYLQQTFTSNALDAIIYPEQKNLVVPIGSPSQSGRNGILAALTGSPVVTVPVGFSNSTATAPEGVPIGMEILGRSWTEEKLLRIALQIQEIHRVRRTPGWAKEDVELVAHGSVPVVEPERRNIPPAYPVGTLGEN
ncbi:Amidase [Teratosphaeria destructans]|uniref:Amidase n=1 Tax=Teratosphaeria destructans TaxID=418781 RepID=A0A9W7SPA5_9PEZI|nr:Amidase [Teratosphaeria destructans]